ncbi:ubiquitin-like modifier-activating enzyme 6-like [Planoprotostelium fungivorum]|uniref:Ubiquitin-like modifier-activating enzyme 6-like n=1 Tax=Planoprotostelium fungivorum TaxID=1890364 RepID=A0A2P6NGZ8_9EUKA|nr:ubiquitin-like modifier-activating enzyme 6-like [Planoprotostelium fungivorum]
MKKLGHKFCNVSQISGIDQLDNDLIEKSIPNRQFLLLLNQRPPAKVCHQWKTSRRIGDMVQKRPRPFHDCVAFARISLQLLHAFSIDHKTDDEGTLFWSTPKKPPKVIEFDINDVTRHSFVASVARLYSKWKWCALRDAAVVEGAILLWGIEIRQELMADVRDSSEINLGVITGKVVCVIGTSPRRYCIHLLDGLRWFEDCTDEWRRVYSKTRGIAIRTVAPLAHQPLMASTTRQ